MKKIKKKPLKTPLKPLIFWGLKGIFNGINKNAVNDGQRPELNIFLNDESFFNGDLTTDKPKLIIE